MTVPDAEGSPQAMTVGQVSASAPSIDASGLTDAAAFAEAVTMERYRIHYCDLEWEASEYGCGGKENHQCKIRMLPDSTHDTESIHYCVCGTTYRVKPDGAKAD